MTVHHSMSGSNPNQPFTGWLQAKTEALRAHWEHLISESAAPIWEEDNDQYDPDHFPMWPPQTRWEWEEAAFRAAPGSTRNATESGMTETILIGLDAAAEATLRSNALSTKSGTDRPLIWSPMVTETRRDTFGRKRTSRASLGRRR